MRTIHDIHDYEEKVVEGTYTYPMADGKLENWTVHRLPDGALVLRADVDGREATGESVLVHVLHAPDGGVDRLQARVEMPGWKAELQLSCFDGYATVSRQSNGQWWPASEVEFPAGAAVVAPCMASNILSAYDRQAGGEQLLAHLGLGHGWQSAEDFNARAGEMPVTLAGQETLELADVGSFEVEKFAEGGFALAYVDEHGVLLQRDTLDGKTIAKLLQYTRYDS